MVSLAPIRLIQLGFNILTPAASRSCADSACDKCQCICPICLQVELLSFVLPIVYYGSLLSLAHHASWSKWYGFSKTCQWLLILIGIAFAAWMRHCQYEFWRAVTTSASSAETKKLYLPAHPRFTARAESFGPSNHLDLGGLRSDVMVHLLRTLARRDLRVLVGSHSLLRSMLHAEVFVELINSLIERSPKEINWRGISLTSLWGGFVLSLAVLSFGLRSVRSFADAM